VFTDGLGRGDIGVLLTLLRPFTTKFHLVPVIKVVNVNTYLPLFVVLYDMSV